MKSWANGNNNKPITNITHSNRLISFEFMGNTNAYTITATCEENGSISPSGITTVYEGSSQGYIITPNTHYERETVLINNANNPNAVTSGIYNFSNVDSNQTIHATFLPKSYRVVFMSNGGTGMMTPQEFTYGIAQNLTANTFTRAGYIFKEWNTRVNGSGTSYPDESSMLLTLNVTLYAQWREDVGIKENAAYSSSIQIIPNPANSYVELRISPAGGGRGWNNYELGITDIEFYNVLGGLVKRVSCNTEMIDNVEIQRISIVDLRKGIYFIKVGNKTAKLVVQ